MVTDPYSNIAYLIWESFHKNSDEKIEEHVIAKSHESHEVKRSPVRSVLHTGEQNDVPVLLS